MTDKPFSPACERNRTPIANVLSPLFASVTKVLEIGSGTGQHAVYFAAKMPHLVWQTSDLAQAHDGIRKWIEEAALTNVLGPLALDVNEPVWPVSNVDAVFTANTLHIVSWPGVQNMFAGVSRVLKEHGLFCVYGPFRYGGKHTAESNARFDLALRTHDERSGIRDFNDVRDLAQKNRLALLHDEDMPANNRLLVFGHD